MLSVQRKQDGTYCIPIPSMLFGGTRRVLPRAVLAGGSSASTFEMGTYGWLSKVLPAPEPDGRYIVEFLEYSRVRIVAYCNQAGSVYATDDLLDEVPDREPDLELEFVAGSDNMSEWGVFQANVDEGDTRRIAYCQMQHGRYSLYGSWYDFGSYAQGLAFEDLVARVYLACILRPKLIGTDIPECGFSVVDAMMSSHQVGPSLAALVDTVHEMQRDAMIRPPALIQALVHSLDDIGVEMLRNVNDGSLNLIRTTHYADLFYLGVSGGLAQDLPEETVLAVEGALNCYRLAREQLGSEALTVDMDACSHAMSDVVENIGKREGLPVFFEDDIKLDRDKRRFSQDDTMPPAEGAFSLAAGLTDAEEQANLQSSADADALSNMQCTAVDELVGDACGSAIDWSGEWDMRCSLVTAIECLRLPYRTTIQFKSSLSAHTALIGAFVPGYACFPTSAWSKTEQKWVALTQADRRDASLRYALHVGVAAARCAFASSPRIERVVYDAGYGWASGEPQLRLGNLGSDARVRRACRIVFTRTFIDQMPPASQSTSTLLDWWARHGGVWGYPDADDVPEHALPAEKRNAVGEFDLHELFADFAASPEQAAARDLPEVADCKLAETPRYLLGAQFASEMRITDSAGRRRSAEVAADTLSVANSDTEAIRMMRTLREDASDPFDVEGSVRVMKALAEGELDVHDQNAVVNCYMGTDLNLQSLMNAQQLAESDNLDAVDPLIEAITQAEESGAYKDDVEVVHRVFDTYSSRLLYNLARAGRLKLDIGHDLAVTDGNKRVELVPDTLYLCYLEAARLLETSFTRSDEAIEYGKRAIDLAPTISTGYRRLARTYMLLGDVESAEHELTHALAVGVARVDISLAYYQLGYVKWKQSDFDAAVACYMKSLGMSTVVAVQALAELHQMIAENDLQVDREQDVDEQLVASGIIVAPTARVLRALLGGARGACDSGMFDCAHSLLGSYASYRPDDAAASIFYSLEDSRF